MKFVSLLIILASIQAKAADTTTSVQVSEDHLQIECDGSFMAQQFSKKITLRGTDKSDELIRNGDNILSISGSDKEMLVGTADGQILVAIYGQALLIQDASHNLLVKCIRH